MSNAKHGTARRYALLCRCDICTDGNTQRMYVQRVRREDGVPTVHNASTYRNWGCKCEVCTAAHLDMMRAKRSAAGRGKNYRKEWTSDELALITEKPDGRRYAQTALQLARRLGRSVAAVSQQRSLSHRRGI